MGNVYDNENNFQLFFRQLMKGKRKEEGKSKPRKKHKKTFTGLARFITAEKIKKISSSEESDDSDVIIKGSSARSQHPKLIDTVLQVRL